MKLQIQKKKKVKPKKYKINLQKRKIQKLMKLNCVTQNNFKQK